MTTLVDNSPEAIRVRSQRLGLLLDAIHSPSGERFTWAEIQAELRDRGFEFSRSSWYHMRTGSARYKPTTAFLRALADVFGVDPGYLLRVEGEVPEEVERELGAVLALRKAEIESFAARSLEGLSPELLQRILDVFDDDEK